MYLDHEDLVTFCGESEIQSDAVLKGMDGEIVALKRLVSIYFCLQLNLLNTFIKIVLRL